MKRNGKAGNGQMEFAPLITIPAIVLPQPGGAFLVKPGKPVVESEWIRACRAAKILGLSHRQVRELCEEGLLEAKRPGKRMYLVSLRSVMERNGDVMRDP